eukprot:6074263-Prymnesium_polylepis.2
MSLSVNVLFRRATTGTHRHCVLFMYVAVGVDDHVEARVPAHQLPLEQLQPAAGVARRVMIPNVADAVHQWLLWRDELQVRALGPKLDAVCEVERMACHREHRHIPLGGEVTPQPPRRRAPAEQATGVVADGVIAIGVVDCRDRNSAGGRCLLRGGASLRA